jgi:hypothetical protein
MKKYLLLIFLFILMGCATSYEPVTHPDQRILFEGFSFYLPSGENWEVFHETLEDNLFLETFGKFTYKFKIFKKTAVGQNQAPEKAEKIYVNATKREFAAMNFDHVDALRGLMKAISNYYTRAGDVVLKSDLFDEEFKGMICVKNTNKKEGIYRQRSGSRLAMIVHVQRYGCVHPRHPNQVIGLRFEQFAPKGQTLTDFQNEVDQFFRSLKVEGN